MIRFQKRFYRDLDEDDRDPDGRTVGHTQADWEATGEDPNGWAKGGYSAAEWFRPKERD